MNFLLNYFTYLYVKHEEKEATTPLHTHTTYLSIYIYWQYKDHVIFFYEFQRECIDSNIKH